MTDDKQDCKCPKCGEELQLIPTVKAFENYETTMVFKPKEGCLFDAKTIGESICTFAALLNAASKEIGGIKMVQLVKNIEMSANGEISVTFLSSFAPQAQKTKQGDLGL